MLPTQTRRRSSTRLAPGLLNKSINNGSSIEFRWSTAAVRQNAKPVNRPPTPLPSPQNAGYQPKARILTSTPLSTHANSSSPNRRSTASSLLSNKKYPHRTLYALNRIQTSETKTNDALVTKASIPANRCPTPFRPLLLSYAQLHRPDKNQEKRLPRRQSRMSIDKASSISEATTRLSFDPRASFASTTVESTIEELHLPEGHPVRLRTPQLRRLNISEKYIHEAKELYFDPTSRVFLPRVSTTNAS